MRLKESRLDPGLASSHRCSTRGRRAASPARRHFIASMHASRYFGLLNRFEDHICCFTWNLWPWSRLSRSPRLSGYRSAC